MKKLPVGLLLLFGLQAEAQIPVWNASANVKAIWDIYTRQHNTRKSNGLYEANKFVYAKNDGLPELDEAIISELKSMSETVVVIQSDKKAREIAKDYPGHLVFSIAFDRTIGSTTRNNKTDFMDLSFFTATLADEVGDCGYQVLNDLFCFPPEVIAKMLVHGQIGHYKEFGEFMAMTKSDHFKATKTYHAQNLKSLQNQTMYVADSDLSVDPSDLATFYPGKIEVVSKERIFEIIRNAEDLIVMITPNDDCEFKVDETNTGNTKYIFNSRSGRCYYRIGGAPGPKGKNRFGFEKFDLASIANPKEK